MCFEVIGVLDIKRGQAVHAVAGRRAHYQPLRSILHPSSDPIELARSFRDTLALETIYVADLDSIEGGRPTLELYRRLADLLPQVWIDAGIRDATSAGPLLELDGPGISIVAGLETIGGPQELAAVLSRAGAERVVFSLDLNDGHPRLADQDAWATIDPFELARRAIEQGVRRLVILDLYRVGTGHGAGTEELMIRIREAYPAVDVFVGGGIAQVEEIGRIREAGSRGVLLASTLHDGRIGARELAGLADSGLLNSRFCRRTELIPSDQ